MSKPNAIICKNYRTPFFSGAVCRHLFTQPKGMSHAAWQKKLKRFLRACIKKRRPLKSTREGRKTLMGKLYSEFKKKQNKHREQFISEQTTMILDQLTTTDSEKKEDIKLELITMLKQFCERKGIHEQVKETIPDRRNQDLIVYSKQSLMMSVMMIFLFRMASGNRFDVSCG